jgi:hypothetical protein
MRTKEISTKKVHGKKRQDVPIDSNRSQQAARTKSISGTATSTSGERYVHGVPRRKPVKLDVRAEDGKVVITLPRFDPPSPSNTRKSLVIASTRGVKRTSLLVNDSPVHVVASVFFYDNGGQPPVKREPLFEPPKQDDDDDEDDDAKQFEAVKELAEEDEY